MNKGDVQEKVLLCLLRSNEARNSDRVLCLDFYSEWLDKPADEIRITDIFVYGVPSPDTITRIRRKLTEDRKDLRGCERVEDARYEKQVEWIEYSEEVI